MVNYANSKVYKIWSTQGDKIYVGSTTKEYLSQRMDKHRSGYRQYKNGKYGHTSSFDIFEEYGIKNCFIELLESKECNSKDELSQLEGKYIRELNCVNKKIEGRTDKEWRDDNKEYFKKYYEYNKIKLLEQQNQKHTCECGGKFTHCNKLHHLKTTKHCQFMESLSKLIQ